MSARRRTRRPSHALADDDHFARRRGALKLAREIDGHLDAIIGGLARLPADRR